MGIKTDKTEDIHFRVTPEEKLQMQTKAEKAGLSLSEYLIRQGLSRKVTVVPPELFAEYRSMCAEFGRLGNNMNQIARHLNSGGSDSTVIRWFENNCRELDDIVMKLKMMYEKKLAA
ncbi:TPA: plasmid mobilization relaxosome protein MobC [Streptococcus suis]|nr:hypothetical protein lbkm_0361 [Lachnospiraceae bacterium KM106-2]